MKSRKFRKMNKNKSRKNRVTHKRKNHKKINRTRKGGMPKKKRSRSQMLIQARNRPPLLDSIGRETIDRAMQALDNDRQIVTPLLARNRTLLPIRTSERLTLARNRLGREAIDRAMQALQALDNDRQIVTPLLARNRTLLDSIGIETTDRAMQARQAQDNTRRFRVDFNDNGLNINGNSPSQTKIVSWFDFLSNDTPTEGDMAACTIPTNIDGPTILQACETPIGNKDRTINITPDTTAVIVSTSLVNFAGIITNYLNKKIKSLTPKKRVQIMAGSESVDNKNYYDTFLRYLQHVKGFKIYGENPHDNNKLNEYFKAALSNNTFDRKYFFEFVKKILPQFEDQLDKVSLRIDYTGKPLAQITQQQTGTQGEIYIPYFEKNKKSGVLCNNDEKTWVFECIKNRNNNYISAYDNGKNKWITLGKKTTPTLENKIKNINSNMSHYNLKKKPCGRCWICNQKIYHYYIYRGTQDIPENRIYLNTKCGEDEHVFPPTIGDIIGTLNMDSDLTRKTIDQYGIHTLLTYGIRPSHAFCNQMKSDFLLYALMNLGTGTVPNIHNYIETKWEATVLHWFQKGRHHSLENIKGIFETMPQNPVNFANLSGDINSETTGTSTSMVNTSNTSSGRNREANNYYVFTLQNMKNYLNTNIAPRILEQATLGQSDVGNMLKLKMLIYIIQIGKNIIGKPFLDQWNN